ncbi:MAG: hypothetical protein PHW37_03670 [Acholeplasmataceae bacterium]|nr:hypothetical protein [Acholeplasmataceae bacterium]MDD4194349.1 hypothetical protein [Acholeplasmataceae bacterium]MDY0339081.1 hypothetical protein [Acholeplasmataceae bacterium]NCU39935.1 hypothetical protein [Candidatus Falkowbacteria bacterium]
MDVLLPILISTMGYFFFAYFIFIISGRKSKLAQGILYFLALLSVFENVIRRLVSLSFEEIVLGVLISALPPILAVICLLILTNGFSLRTLKFKKNKLKGIKEIKDTVYYQMKFVYLSIFVPIILSIIALYYLESLLLYAFLVLSFSVIIYGIISFLKLRLINDECLVLLIGKNKENIFIQKVKPKTNHIDIKSYFDNENYLIDHLGVIELKKDKKTIKHHLYWIGTSEKVIFNDQDWEKIAALDYQDDLMSFEKYHYIQSVYQITDNQVTKIKSKRIK